MACTMSRTNSLLSIVEDSKSGLLCRWLEEAAWPLVATMAPLPSPLAMFMCWSLSESFIVLSVIRCRFLAGWLDSVSDSPSGSRALVAGMTAGVFSAAMGGCPSAAETGRGEWLAIVSSPGRAR